MNDETTLPEAQEPRVTIPAPPPNFTIAPPAQVECGAAMDDAPCTNRDSAVPSGVRRAD